MPPGRVLAQINWEHRRRMKKRHWESIAVCRISAPATRNKCPLAGSLFIGLAQKGRHYGWKVDARLFSHLVSVCLGEQISLHRCITQAKQKLKIKYWFSFQLCIYLSFGLSEVCLHTFVQWKSVLTKCSLMRWKCNNHKQVVSQSDPSPFLHPLYPLFC